GQRLTDRPATVAPTLGDVLRGYNDGLDDERRQSLKRYAAASLGTARGHAAERQRRRLLRAWLKSDAKGRGWPAAFERGNALLDRPHVGYRLAARVRVGNDD